MDDWVNGGVVSSDLMRELQLFRAIADHSQAVIGAKDLEGRYLFVNGEYSRLFHRAGHEFIGRTDLELFPPEIAREFRKADLRVQKNRQTLQFEEVAPVDGQLRHFLSVKFPIFDQNGELYATGLIATDITSLRQLNNELKLLADTDGLTGLHNRRKFFEIGQQEVQRAQRYNFALSLVMFDLDHFKAINDQFGHAVGDRVLCDFAHLLAGKVRSNDSLGRLGGEEFAVLMPHTSVTQAVSWVERLQKRLRNWALKLDDGSTVRLSVSAGISPLDVDHNNFEQMLSRADGLLYEAKAAGRDCVIYQDG